MLSCPNCNNNRDIQLFTNNEQKNDKIFRIILLFLYMGVGLGIFALGLGSLGKNKDTDYFNSVTAYSLKIMSYYDTVGMAYICIGITMFIFSLIADKRLNKKISYPLLFGFIAIVLTITAIKCFDVVDFLKTFTKKLDWDKQYMTEELEEWSVKGTWYLIFGIISAIIAVVVFFVCRSSKFKQKKHAICPNCQYTWELDN